MPVVRELVNRISFKVNPADKKNAQDVIANLDRGSRNALTNIKGIGLAIGATLSGASAVLAKISVENEQNRAAIAFFSKNKEQREEVIALSVKQAAISKTISEREAIQSAKTLSILNITKKQFEDIIPLAAKVSEARPAFDFQEVTDLVSGVIKGGDLGAIEQLVPGFKGQAELLSKSRFGTAFGEVTQEQRGELLIDLLKKSIPQLEELAKEQADTLSFQFTRIGKSGSDVLTTLEKGFNVLAKRPAKFIAGAVSEESVDLTNRRKRLAKADSLTEGFFNELIKDTKEEIKSFKKTVGFSDEQAGQKDEEKDGLFSKAYKNINDSLDASGRISRGGNGKNKEESTDQNININLNGSIRVEDKSGDEIIKIGTELTDFIFGELKSGLNNISAQNGASLVGVP